MWQGMEEYPETPTPSSSQAIKLPRRKWAAGRFVGNQVDEENVRPTIRGRRSREGLLSMKNRHPTRQRLARKPIAVLLLAAALAVAANAGEPMSAPAVPTTGSEALDLEAAVQRALERHPRLAARRASLAAAQDGQRALAAIRVPDCLVPELPIRRKQAALGVSAAAAALEQAEKETAYAASRTWFTVQFAREQLLVAGAVVERLSATHDAAQRGLKAGARGVTGADVNRALVYLRLAQTRRIQAEQGVRRALAALKEAVGAEPELHLDVPRRRLGEPAARPNRDEVLAQALARRGEIVQASLFAQVVCLEAAAQATSCRKRMETFAAGADLHAHEVPPTQRNNEYRPGATPPKMPAVLVGPRAERVRRAQSLCARAEAGLAQARNLVALEAEDAFLRWEASSGQAARAKEAVQAGEKLAADLNEDFRAEFKVRVEDMVNAQVLASQARAQYNEYLYKQILALLDLERITAGAFSAGLGGR
jgi:outer membrane protein TolC